MKKGEKIHKMLSDPEFAGTLGTMNQRLSFVLTCVYLESNEQFERLEGLTWPNGNGVLISRSSQRIENSFTSATAMQIPASPYYMESGHSKKDLKRLAELVLSMLGYPPGIRNEVKAFLEPRTIEETLWKLKTQPSNEEVEQVGDGDAEEAV